jgi:hypothetical protein
MQETMNSRKYVIDREVLWIKFVAAGSNNVCARPGRTNEGDARS